MTNDLLSERGEKSLIMSIKLLQIFFLREYELFKLNTEKPETSAGAFWDSLCQFPAPNRWGGMAGCHACTGAMNNTQISLQLL